ncbi:MAG: HD domain-containing protein [Chloroflexota bacterium]
MEKRELTFEPETLSLLARIYGFLREKGIDAYIVGGFIRDGLLGRQTADIDIALDADAPGVAPGLAAALGGKPVLLDDTNRISRIVLPDIELDFTTLAGSLHEDLAARDFTIDALALPLTDNPEALHAREIIDPFDGRRDLEEGIIRAVSPSAFTADPARLLRAVRLASELDFRIDAETESFIRRDAGLIRDVAGERVRDELLRLLALPESGQTLSYLDELGLLTAIIPELEPARGVDQPTVHHWDVFTHSLKTVAAADFLLRQGEWEDNPRDVLDTVPWSEELAQHFREEVSHGSTRSSLLKLAALLHDIAKPRTKTMEDGRARFLGHPQEGALLVSGIMERLRFTKKESKAVDLMIQYHLRPQQMSHEGLPTGRAIYRYFRDTGETGIDILFLSMADHLATRGPELDGQQWQGHGALLAYVLAEHRRGQETVAPAQIIDGNDLMEEFSLHPGPEIGRLLEAVREALSAGEISNREEAIDYVRKLLRKDDEK